MLFLFYLDWYPLKRKQRSGPTRSRALAFERPKGGAEIDNGWAMYAALERASQNSDGAGGQGGSK
jgi:hypothetical protein